jgi:hypothetical protein
MPRAAPRQRLARLAVACLLLTGVAAPSAQAADGRLVITVVDRDTGKPIAARMHLRRADGKARKPKGVPFWHDHFVFPGRIELDLPKGNYIFELERGLEYLTQTGHFTIEAFADDAKQVDMKRFVDMSAQGWWSGDLDVRRTADEVELAMSADDLHVATIETWSNRPGVKPPKDKPKDNVRNKAKGDAPADKVVRFDRDRYYSLVAGECVWPGTTLFCLNAAKPVQLPAADREFPPPLAVVKSLREQPGAWVDLSRTYCWDLPMLVAAGQIDSIEIAQANLCRDAVIDNEGDGRPRDRKLYPGVAGNARWSQDIYFKLLDCGLRIPPSAGSGSGDAPNPVGYNRMYVHVEGPLDYEKWWQGLRAGRVTVTNGPLLLPRVQGQLPGYVFQAAEGETAEFEIALTLSTREPISYLEIVKNGQVEHTIRLEEYKKAGKLPKVRFDRSGWFLVRAVTDLPKTYRFAMTGPYYVEIAYQRRISRSAVQFFVDWVYDRARQVQKIEDPTERAAVLAAHRAARDYWQGLLGKANAE